jgi:hypothetical protein
MSKAEYQRAWYARNREKMRLYHKKWHALHPMSPEAKKRHSERSRQWYLANHEKALESRQKWAANHKEYLREYGKKRRAMQPHRKVKWQVGICELCLTAVGRYSTLCQECMGLVMCITQPSKKVQPILKSLPQIKKHITNTIRRNYLWLKEAKHSHKELRKLLRTAIGINAKRSRSRSAA